MTEAGRPDPNQGIFETMLVLDGRPVELDAHLARLEASLAELFRDRVAPDLAAEIENRASGVAQGAVRATVTPTDTAELNMKVELRHFSGALLPISGSKAPAPPVALHELRVPDGLGAHKWADRTLLDKAEAGLPPDALSLIVDADGAVLEASRANLFAVRDGALFTPPLDGRILPGVTRARVLEIAIGAGVETRETPLRRDDLLAADEVFLTGSVRGIEPAASLDGAALPSGGTLAEQLTAELYRAWLGAPVA